MLVFALGLYRDKALQGKMVEDWSSLGWWKRRTVQEFAHLAMREAHANKATINQITTSLVTLVPFVHKEFSCLTGIVTDTRTARRLVVLVEASYPQRPLATLLLQHFPPLIQGSLFLPSLFDTLTSPPQHSLRLEGIRTKLDETKLVILDSIEKVLETGVKLDELVQKSDDLSQASKMFHRRSKSLSSRCCTIS